MPVTSRKRFDLRRCVPMSREEEHLRALKYVDTRDPALTERLVLAQVRPRTQIIVLTVHDGLGYLRAAGKAGADAFFVSPPNAGIDRSVR
jgi:hypothetical protein